MGPYHQQSFDSSSSDNTNIDNEVQSAEQYFDLGETPLRHAVYVLVSNANKSLPSIRKVSYSNALRVAERSLTASVGKPTSARRVDAVRDVYRYLSAASSLSHRHDISDFCDLLPIGHPESTAAPYMDRQFRSSHNAAWILSDLRLSDDIRPVVASAFTTNRFSPERDYLLAKLSSFSVSDIPSDLRSAVTALLAAGLGANKGFWMRQARDRKGRFAFMGGGMRVFLTKNAGDTPFSQSGAIVDVSEDGTSVEFTLDSTDPDIPKNKVFKAPAASVESIEAILPSTAVPKSGEGKKAARGADDAAILLSDLIANATDSPSNWKEIPVEKTPGGPDRSYQLENSDYIVDVYDELNDENSASALGGEEIAGGAMNVWTGGGPKGKPNPQYPVMVIKRDASDYKSPGAMEVVGRAQNWGRIAQIGKKDAPAFEKALKEGKKPANPAKKKTASNQAADDYVANTEFSAQELRELIEFIFTPNEIEKLDKTIAMILKSKVGGDMRKYFNQDAREDIDPNRPVWSMIESLGKDSSPENLASLSKNVIGPMLNNIPDEFPNKKAWVLAVDKLDELVMSGVEYDEKFKPIPLPSWKKKELDALRKKLYKAKNPTAKNAKPFAVGEKPTIDLKGKTAKDVVPDVGVEELSEEERQYIEEQLKQLGKSSGEADTPAQIVKKTLGLKPGDIKGRGYKFEWNGDNIAVIRSEDGAWKILLPSNNEPYVVSQDENGAWRIEESASGVNVAEGQTYGSPGEAIEDLGALIFGPGTFNPFDGAGSFEETPAPAAKKAAKKAPAKKAAKKVPAKKAAAKKTAAKKAQPEEPPVEGQPVEAPVDQEQVPQEVVEAPQEVVEAPQEVVEAPVSDLDTDPGLAEEELPKLDEIDEIVGVRNLDNFEKVSGPRGSNPGGIYRDPETGEEYYVKLTKSQLHAENEVLAAKLYQLLGIKTADVELGIMNGAPAVFSKMQSVESDLDKKLNGEDPEFLDELRSGFLVDALLANWDVAGLNYDNVVTDENGDPVRIDVGGSLLFRAQGAPKGGAFGEEVSEIDTLRDPYMNATSADVFGDMTEEELTAAAERLLGLKDSDINELVYKYITDPVQAAAVADTLIKRRDNILERFGLSADGEATAAEAPAAPELVEAPNDAPEGVTADTIEAPETSDEEVADQAPLPPSPYADVKPELPRSAGPYSVDANGNYYLSGEYDPEDLKAIFDGTMMPAQLPFVGWPDTSETFYIDTTGVKRWGPYGAAGAVIRREKDGVVEYFLVRRKPTASTNPDVWSIPGGSHDNREDSALSGVTSRRELDEEISGADDATYVATNKNQAAPDWAYDYDIYDVAEGTELGLVSTESVDSGWFTRDQILEMAQNDELHPAFEDKILEDLFSLSDKTPYTKGSTKMSEEEKSNLPKPQVTTTNLSEADVEEPAQVETEAPETEAPAVEEDEVQQAPVEMVETSIPSVQAETGKDGQPATDETVRVEEPSTGSVLEATIETQEDGSVEVEVVEAETVTDKKKKQGKIKRGFKKIFGGKGGAKEVLGDVVAEFFDLEKNPFTKNKAKPVYIEDIKEAAEVTSEAVTEVLDNIVDSSNLSPETKAVLKKKYAKIRPTPRNFMVYVNGFPAAGELHNTPKKPFNKPRTSEEFDALNASEKLLTPQIVRTSERDYRDTVSSVTEYADGSAQVWSEFIEGKSEHVLPSKFAEGYWTTGGKHYPTRQDAVDAAIRNLHRLPNLETDPKGAESNDPNMVRNLTPIFAEDVVDADLIMQTVLDTYPQNVQLSESHVELASRLFTAKNGRKYRYQIIVHRTEQQRFVAYVLETDLQTGEVRAFRPGRQNELHHSFKSLNNSIGVAAGMLAAENPRAVFQDKAKKNAGNPGKFVVLDVPFATAEDIPELSDKIKQWADAQGGDPENLSIDYAGFMQLVAEMGATNPDVVGALLRKSFGDSELYSQFIDDVMVELDRQRMQNWFTYTNSLFYGNVPDSEYMSYDGEVIEVGMLVDWTAPNGKVYRGIVKSLYRESVSHGDYIYNDYAYVVFPQYNKELNLVPSKWNQRTTQNLRIVKSGDPLSAPFQGKVKEAKEVKESFDTSLNTPGGDTPPPTEPGHGTPKKPTPGGPGGLSEISSSDLKKFGHVYTAKSDKDPGKMLVTYGNYEKASMGTNIFASPVSSWSEIQPGDIVELGEPGKTTRSLGHILEVITDDNGRLAITMARFSKANGDNEAPSIEQFYVDDLSGEAAVSWIKSPIHRPYAKLVAHDIPEDDGPPTNLEEAAWADAILSVAEIGLGGDAKSAINNTSKLLTDNMITSAQLREAIEYVNTEIEKAKLFAKGKAGSSNKNITEGNKQKINPKDLVDIVDEAILKLKQSGADSTALNDLIDAATTAVVEDDPNSRFTPMQPGSVPKELSSLTVGSPKIKNEMFAINSITDSFGLAYPELDRLSRSQRIELESRIRDRLIEEFPIVPKEAQGRYVGTTGGVPAVGDIVTYAMPPRVGGSLRLFGYIDYKPNEDGSSNSIGNYFVSWFAIENDGASQADYEEYSDMLGDTLEIDSGSVNRLSAYYISNDGPTIYTTAWLSPQKSKEFGINYSLESGIQRIMNEEFAKVAQEIKPEGILGETPMYSSSLDFGPGVPEIPVDETAGAPDWSSSDFEGVPSLQDVFGMISNPNMKGFNRASGIQILADGTSLEDLSLMVSRLKGSFGSLAEEVTKVDTTLTAWAGDNLLARILDGSIEAKKQNIVRPYNVRIDDEDNMPYVGQDSILDGSAASFADPSKLGFTYTIPLKDAEGNVIGEARLFRASDSPTTDNFLNSNYKTYPGPMAMHNKVSMVLYGDNGMQADKVADALSQLGVNARPATKENLRTLAENKLMHLFNVKADGRRNISNPEVRATLLSEIKEKYGVGPEDFGVTFNNNRAVVELKDINKAQKIAESFNFKPPGAFVHGFEPILGRGDGIESDEEFFFKNLTGQSGPGIMSVAFRALTGNYVAASSGSGTDIYKAGGNGAFVRYEPRRGSGEDEGSHVVGFYRRFQIEFNPAKVFATGSFHANRDDSFGALYGAALEGLDMAYPYYEFIAKNGLLWSDVDLIRIKEGSNSSITADMIDYFEANGIYEINGKPLDEFFIREYSDDFEEEDDDF